MSFDKFLLAVESCDLSQADTSIIRVSSLPNTVKYLVGLEIKTVRTVLNSCGIHRLLVCFRAYLTIYNSQTFFLPQDIKL